MGKTVINCGYINPGGTEGLENLVHTGAGRLVGFLATTGQATAQTVTFYDHTSAVAGQEILAVSLTVASPIFVMFPRQEWLSFQDGLYIAATNCHVAIWAVLYS